MKNRKKLLITALSLTFVLIGCNSNEPFDSESEISSEKVLTSKKIYILGDSLSCEFNDATYYYPRYGFGTQLYNYFDSSLEVVNLALSGRSSKSYILENNYNIFKNSISEGDYLLLAFGHNDEKSDDVDRFTDASLPLSNENSFKYSLYENYIKIAEEKGASTILSTPIVRLSTSDDYSSKNGHITENGNYAEAIRELGKEKDVPVIDLTSLTKELYTTLTYEEAKWFHAVTSGKMDSQTNEVVANFDSIDKTHLNIYGAKMVAYLFANCIKNSDIELKNYVNENIIKPTKENDLVANSSYVFKEYTSPNLNTYVPGDNFKTISEGWYGTAFGSLGGDPLAQKEEIKYNGYIASEEIEGIFKVGQNLKGTQAKGKIASKEEGFAYLFRQVDASLNFKLSVDAKIINELDQSQSGFGLMIRDDCYLPKNDSSLIGNSISSGLLCNKEDMSVFFTRSNGSLSKGSNTINGYYQTDDTLSLSIERLGQKVTVSLNYKDNDYKQEYLDFPLQERDKDYMYIGMFSTRGTIVEYSNVNFEITGNAIEA